MAVEGLRQGSEWQTTGDDIEDDDFESIFDVPYITVNKIAGKYLAEVLLSGNEQIDLNRIQTALDVGAEHGVRAYANVQGDYGNVTIHFAPADGVVRAGA